MSECEGSPIVSQCVHYLMSLSGSFDECVAQTAPGELAGAARQPSPLIQGVWRTQIIQLHGDHLTL